MIIGIHGLKHSGKSTVAGVIKDYYLRKYLEKMRKEIPPVGCEYTIKEDAFAAPIKKVALALGFTEESVYGKDKETWKHPALDVTFREFAQKFGTDFMRETICRHTFTRLLAHRNSDLKPNTILIVDDVRFADELETLVDMSEDNYILIKVKRNNVLRRTTGVDAHKSEKGLNDTLFDLVIDNDGSKELLKERLEEWLDERRKW